VLVIFATGHCSVWLDGWHSQPVQYSNNTGCPVDLCQQDQLETVWNQRDLSQWESLNNIFDGQPCGMHADYLPSLCSWYSPSFHDYWEWIHFF
jgi:hypothetical protein